MLITEKPEPFANPFKCLLSGLHITPFLGSVTSTCSFSCQNQLCFSLELFIFSHISQLLNGATSDVSYTDAVLTV